MQNKLKMEGTKSTAKYCCVKMINGCNSVCAANKIRQIYDRRVKISLMIPVLEIEQNPHEYWTFAVSVQMGDILFFRLTRERSQVRVPLRPPRQNPHGC